MQENRSGGAESDAPTAESARRERHYAWAISGFLILAVGLIFGQTLRHVLLDYDDNGFVQANPLVTGGLTFQGVKWAFTQGPYGEWYPLAPLSHMLDCQLFGLNASGHHLTNLLLHAAASVALFLVLWRMTDELWPSGFVAAVFAVHPQHVESVAWVAERRDVLSGLLFMLTLAAYLGYVRHGRSLRRYLLVIALLALGLMAKPMLVTVPMLLLLLDFWPLARLGAAGDTPGWTQSVKQPGLLRLVIEKIPLLALSAADCWMTLRTHTLVSAPVPWSSRIDNAATSGLTYIGQFFYPVDLAIFYPYPETGVPAWKVVGSLTFLVIVSAAAVIWRRRSPYFFVGWFWFLGMLFPVIGLVTVSDHARADRYMYLPGIGLYIAISWGAARLFANSLSGRRWLAAGAGLTLVLLSVCAARQTSYWYDDETLWRHDLACTVANSEAETALASALARNGQRDEAISYFQRAQQHAPDGEPFNNLGVMLDHEGKTDEAIAQYRLALDHDPKYLLAHVNLIAALARQGKLDEAREYVRRAAEINPQDVSAYLVLARIFLSQGKNADARVEIERAISIDPRNAAAQNEMGVTYVSEGNAEQAIPYYAAAVAIDPYFAVAQNNLAHALATCGRNSEAIIQYRRAVQLDPRNWDARAALDGLLHKGPGQPHR
jgi:protein O-mannosyl-transferase